MRVLNSQSVCPRVCASIIWLSACPRGHNCVRREKEGKKEERKNLCVCVSLLSLASNWIFCPEFVLPLCGRKAAEGYNSERSHAF